MESLFFNLNKSAGSQIRLDLRTSCDRAADFASLPGFAKLKAFGLRSGKVSRRWGTGAELTDPRYASSSPSRADAACLIDPPWCVGFGRNYILIVAYLGYLFCKHFWSGNFFLWRKLLVHFELVTFSYRLI